MKIENEILSFFESDISEFKIFLLSKLISILENQYQVQFLNRRPKSVVELHTSMVIDLQTARSISLLGQKTFSLEICLLDAIKYYCQTSDGAKLAEERLKNPLSGIYDVEQKHSLVYLLKTSYVTDNNVTRTGQDEATRSVEK